MWLITYNLAQMGVDTPGAKSEIYKIRMAELWINPLVTAGAPSSAT